MNLEVYVNGDHPVFREFGRDPRDYAIMEIAQSLARLLVLRSDHRFGRRGHRAVPRPTQRHVGTAGPGRSGIAPYPRPLAPMIDRPGGGDVGLTPE